MHTLLHVNSSPRGTQSQSLALANSFLDEVLERHAEVKVDAVNLFEDHLPAFGTDAAAAKYAAFAGQQPTSEAAEAWQQARAVFDRLDAADTCLFNVPMWNAGVPYVLKQWIDIVTQPGWAFGFDPTAGYSGLLKGKRAVVIYTSGVYAPGTPPQFGSDFHSTFFTDWLRFVGITDISELRLSANALSATPDADLERAHDEARSLADRF